MDMAVHRTLYPLTIRRAWRTSLLDDTFIIVAIVWDSIKRSYGKRDHTYDNKQWYPKHEEYHA